MNNAQKIIAKKALSKVIEILGSASELARRIGVRQQSVFLWVLAGRIPAARVLQIEEIVTKQVTRYQMRPDIYGQPD